MSFEDVSKAGTPIKPELDKLEKSELSLGKSEKILTRARLPREDQNSIIHRELESSLH